MYFDIYHGEPRDGETGPRVHNMLRTERIAVVCGRCKKAKTYGWETFRGFPPTTPTRLLPDYLPPTCWRYNKEPIEGCERVVISPEDGCSDAG